MGEKLIQKRRIVNTFKEGISFEEIEIQ